MGAEPPYVAGSLVDHHCHGLVGRDLDRDGLERLLNESARRSPLGTSVFDSMIGLAFRRHCAPLLDLEPLADVDTYVERRRELGHREVARRMLSAAGCSDFVVDTGYLPELVSSPDELAALAGGAGAHEVVRLELVAEELLSLGLERSGFAEALTDRLQTCGAVGAKSIAAYRTGLGLPATKPGEAAVTRALTAVRAEASPGFRIAQPDLHGYLAWTAIELGLPLQVHVGYGDADIDLAAADPLLLTPFLRASQEHAVPVLLLHNYPYHRHASYLAQVFDHVFMDVGLAVHNTGALARTLVSESLELVPFGKMLYSSDAFGLPELYLLGATLFRQALSSVLTGLVEQGEMGVADAEHVASLISADNARRVYRLTT